MRALAAGLCLLGLFVTVPATAADPPVHDLGDGRTGKIYFESVTPTGFFQLAERESLMKTVIFGTLSLSKKATAPMPAMLIAHGSGGVSHEREFWWADHFNDIGVAAFVVDSFTPRNIRETATDQSQLSTAANVADALAALRLLATHPKLDAKRIGVIGFSKGGQVALYTALEPFRRAIIADETRFAAHAPLYPFCNSWYVSDQVTGTPMLMLLGGRDNYTPPDCHVVKIRATGEDVTRTIGSSMRTCVGKARWSAASAKGARNRPRT